MREVIKEGRLNIATNSVRMMYNYRDKFIKDVGERYAINYVLSQDLDTVLQYGETFSIVSKNAASSGLVALLRDFFKIFFLLLRLRGRWLVFTARNILLFGLAARFTFRQLDIAYYAGLGKGMNADGINSSKFRMLFWTFVLKNYGVVYCLNRRDKELLEQLHPNVEFIRGEGFDLTCTFSDQASGPYEYDFGFVGRFTYEKGAREFIEFAEKCPTASFVIFGEVEKGISAEINRLANVAVMGFIADKGQIYRRFETLLHLSSLNEGLPFVFFECVVYRKQLFALDNPTTDEFLREVGVEPAFARPVSMDLVSRHASVPVATDDLTRQCSYENTNKRMLLCL